MPLIPLRPLLETVDKYHFAQGAFNVNAVAQAKAAIEVHEMFRSAAILQGADLANGFMGGRTDFQNATLEDKKIGAKNIAAAVKKYAENSPIPVVLAGVEDHVFSATSTYTNPLKAVEFFKKTGCDALAISYGTMHGASKGKNVKLRKEIAIAIKECMMHENLFGVLVSHGSSTVPRYIVDEINALGGNIQNAYGISIEELKAAIPCGIGKINVDTDIRLAVTRNMKEFFHQNPAKRDSASIGKVYELLEEKKDQFDPRAFLPPIMDTVMYGNIPDQDTADLVEVIEKGVKEAIGTLIVEFGSFGKAPLVEQGALEEMAERYKKCKEICRMCKMHMEK